MSGLADVFASMEPGPKSPPRQKIAPRTQLERAFAPVPDVPTMPLVVHLARGSDIALAPIDWLWRGWLPRGKLCLLAGQPGTGKTTLALTLAATLSIGGFFPDGQGCDAGNVLVWSGEDDVADTLLPRLVAAGADPARCYFITASSVDGNPMPFDPSRDLAELLSSIEDIGGVDLLIVDPVVSAVTGDSHKNTEVRRALQPLVDLAVETNAAVLGISHFSKGGQGQDPTQRVIGSVAFAAVARIVMVAAKVQGEEGKDSVANPLYVRSADPVSGITSGATSGSIGGGWLDTAFSLASSAIGGFGNTAATSMANSAGTGLDGLFRYTNNFSGRAGGGWVGPRSTYEVAENAPELLTVGNKTMLMTGNQAGQVTPLKGGGGRSMVVNNAFTINQPATRQTQMQIAREAGLAIQRANARSG